jgi:hypothetical protein
MVSTEKAFIEIEGLALGYEINRLFPTVVWWLRMRNVEA